MSTINVNTPWQSSLGEPRVEDSILFEVNQETLGEMTLTEHICRLEVSTSHTANGPLPWGRTQQK